MIPIVNHIKVGAVAIMAMTVGANAAQAPQHIDVKQLSKRVEDVVVPLPNEVFGALNKLGSVNWKEYVRSNKGSNFTERPRIALLLGTVIADGFIAVQAEDAPAVKEIGQRVLGIGKTNQRRAIQLPRMPKPSSRRRTSANGRMCGRSSIAPRTACSRR